MQSFKLERDNFTFYT